VLKWRLADDPGKSRYQDRRKSINFGAKSCLRTHKSNHLTTGSGLAPAAPVASMPLEIAMCALLLLEDDQGFNRPKID